MEKFRNFWRGVKLYGPSDLSDLYLESRVVNMSVATDRLGCVCVVGFRYSDYRTVYFESSYLTAEQTVLAYDAMVESRHEEIKFGDL